MKELYARNRDEWRHWLAANHDKSAGQLKKALARSKKAKTFFEQLAPSYQKQFIGWITVAKRQETRQRRVDESIALLEQGKRLGLK